MQFRMRNARPGAGIGCGGLLAVFGLVLISPVGEWLVVALGWILLAVGVLVAAATVYSWVTGRRPGRYL